MSRVKSSVIAIVLGACVLTFVATRNEAQAEDGDEADARARCASRLAITLLGTTPSASLLASGDPLSEVDGLLRSEAFSNRFSSFLNAEFNVAPSETPSQDTVYFLSKYIIENDKPWKDLFVGRYDMVLTTDKLALRVVDAPEGLGYFRTLSWMQRYAGNESTGVRLVSAYRMIHNTTGTAVVPSVGQPDDDRTATGRKAGSCKSCHYDAWYALDKAAAVLSKKRVSADGAISFTANDAGPQALLGRTIRTDRDLVEGLVDSDAWKVGQCRFIFKFLFGRTETTCEAELFDRCVDVLGSGGSLRSAVSVIAKDPEFCQ